MSILYCLLFRCLENQWSISCHFSFDHIFIVFLFGLWQITVAPYDRCLLMFLPLYNFLLLSLDGNCVLLQIEYDKGDRCYSLDYFYLLIWERERNREGEKEVFGATYLCIHLWLVVCALTRDGTWNLGVSGRCSHQLNTWDYEMLYQTPCGLQTPSRNCVLSWHWGSEWLCWESQSWGQPLRVEGDL